MEKNRCDIDNKYKWDLTSMIKDDTEYQKIVSEIKLLGDKIKRMQNHLVDSSENLYCYLENSKLLDEKITCLYIYSNLYFYQDMTDKEGLKYKNIAEKLNDELAIKLSFTATEIMNAGIEKIKEFISSDKRLEEYSFYFEKLFRYKDHILTDSEEKILAASQEALGTCEDAFSDLDNTDIDLGFIKDEDNKKVKLTNYNYINYLNSNDRKVRKDAFKNMYNYFEKHINTLSTLYLGCIKENKFISSIRNYTSTLEQSLYSDCLDEEFYNNFIAEIHKYLDLNYKYMNLRNKALGYKSHMYDVYVDLVNKKTEKISYEEAVKHVKNALIPLGNKYLKDLDHAFSDKWIDAMPNKYKRSGAYQWGAYGTNPYVSLNFIGNIDDVSTMSHELGHAMHTYYSNTNQTSTYANYSIFLAEIASTVNEVLVDEYFYKNAKTDDEKILYLQNFLDKVRTTIFRQTMFAEFESIMHKKYSENEVITRELLCNTYYDLNKLYFGKNVVIDKEIQYEWARIPHFYTPFYVYKYATGLISALSIVSDILNGEDINNYLEFLKSGSSDYPLNILKKANVDVTSSKTINKAFKLFEDKLQLLEELIEKKEKNHE